MKIAIAGSSGFIGSHLVSFFRKRGDELVLLTRQKQSGAHFWNPERRQIDPAILEGCDAVINLCGASIIGRWTQSKMDIIRSSRYGPTEFLFEIISQLQHPPGVYMGASAVGYYGNRGREKLTENSRSGHGYLAETCRDWEALHMRMEEQGVRVAIARFGLVLGKCGGALEKMRKPFRFGLGGIIGDGTQIMSWIAAEDCVGALDHILQHPTLSGPFNFVVPESVSNREFTQCLGRVLNKPTPLPVPKWALSLLFGSGAEIFLASLNVVPTNLLESGYPFLYPTLESALQNIFE